MEKGGAPPVEEGADLRGGWKEDLYRVVRLGEALTAAHAACQDERDKVRELDEARRGAQDHFADEVDAIYELLKGHMLVGGTEGYGKAAADLQEKSRAWGAASAPYVKAKAELDKKAGEFLRAKYAFVEGFVRDWGRARAQDAASPPPQEAAARAQTIAHPACVERHGGKWRSVYHCSNGHVVTWDFDTEQEAAEACAPWSS